MTGRNKRGRFVTGNHFALLGRRGGGLHENEGLMRVTINIPRKVVYVAGHAHYLSRVGCQKVFVWLMDHAALLWGWDSGEYVFQLEVGQ